MLNISTKRGRCVIAGKPPKIARLAPIPCTVAQQLAILPYADITIKSDVSSDVQYYLAERSDQFPSVEVQDIYLRNYPLHDLAAQLFGTVGPINLDRGQGEGLPRDLQERDHRPVRAGGGV